MRSSFFWDVTQRTLVVAYHFRESISVPSSSVEGFWTARLLKIRGSVNINIPCVKTQKSEDLIKCSYIAGCSSYRHGSITDSIKL